MKINYNKIRNGDYVEGLAKYRMPETPETYKGIVFLVNHEKNQLSIEQTGTKRAIIIKFSEISYYASVSLVCFNNKEEATKICLARDPEQTKLEVYDRKHKAVKHDRFKIIKRMPK